MRKRNLKLRTETVRTLQGRELGAVRGGYQLGGIDSCMSQCNECTSGVRSVNTVPCNGGGTAG